VLGTVVGTVTMCVAQGLLLRRELGGIEGRRTLEAAAKMLAAGALLGGVAYGVWHGLDSALGRSLIAQITSVGTALLCGFGVYASAVWAMRVPEALQIKRLLMSRGG
jgi:putative peptidoglycan lipid II flippase